MKDVANGNSTVKKLEISLGASLTWNKTENQKCNHHNMSAFNQVSLLSKSQEQPRWQSQIMQNTVSLSFRFQQWLTIKLVRLFVHHSNSFINYQNNLESKKKQVINAENILTFNMIIKSHGHITFPSFCSSHIL